MGTKITSRLNAIIADPTTRRSERTRAIRVRESYAGYKLQRGLRDLTPQSMHDTLEYLQFAPAGDRTWRQWRIDLRDRAILRIRLTHLADPNICVSFADALAAGHCVGGTVEWISEVLGVELDSAQIISDLEYCGTATTVAEIDADLRESRALPTCADLSAIALRNLSDDNTRDAYDILDVLRHAHKRVIGKVPF